MMRELPKISIITPSYNQGDFITEAIESVKRQNYPRVEHIIIDNCSTDTTKEILRKYGHLKWFSEPDNGQSDALNKGFRMATGDIVGWLNADDCYLPDSLFKIAEFLEQNRETDVAYGNFRFIDKQGNVIQNRRELDFDLFMLKYLHILYIPSTATFLKRRVFDEGNFLDPKYHYSMDYEFFLRLALRGYQFVHLDEFLADFRWHEQSKSVKSIQRQKREVFLALVNQDPFLQRCPPFMRRFLRLLLMGLAKLKRYLLKMTKGYYVDQWTNICRRKKI